MYLNRRYVCRLHIWTAFTNYCEIFERDGIIAVPWSFSKWGPEIGCLLAPHQEIRMKKSIYVTSLILSAAILFSIGISIDNSRAADASKITIAYSSNIMGYLEPCG
jgi:hypothetical protein